MKIFVYGTLKKGFYNHHYLENSKLLGTAITKHKYPMINANGYFPYLIDEKNKGKYVQGEVFEIDDTTLEELDILEGYPLLYNRKDIDLIFNDTNIKAVAYFINEEINYNEYVLLENFIE